MQFVFDNFQYDENYGNTLYCLNYGSDDGTGSADDDDVYDADICSAVSTMARNPLNPDSCAGQQPIVPQ